MKNREITSINEKEFINIPKSLAEDVIDGIFVIHLDEEVTELSNHFCKYYYAINSETDEECFAIVFNNEFVHPINNIDLLLKNKVNYLNQILAWSVVRLSSLNKERLVVIVDSYDPEDNLSNYLKNSEKFSILELEEMISQIVDMMFKLESLGMYCYNINPNNILMQDGKFFALREFISSYPNFYQSEPYLAPEIAECHPAGRFINNINGDIYALGLTIFNAYTGKDIWNDHATPTEYNYARFENTTSKYLLSRLRVPERIKVFFKWTLHDEANVRWKLNNLTDWLSGKITKLTHEPITDNNNIIGFNDNNYSNAKSIAYAIFNNWSEAIKLVKDSKLLKWATRQNLSSDTVEQLKYIIDTKQDTSVVVANIINYNEKIAKILSLLDSNGPIRYEGIAFSAASIAYFMHFLVMQNKKELSQRVLKIIKDYPWLLYNNNTDSAGYIETFYSEEYKVQLSFTQLESDNAPLERLAYGLNKYACCNSAILQDSYVNDTEKLMIALDSYAESNIKKLNIDKNIIAFISAKVDIPDNIKSSILPNFPRFADNSVVKGISILNILQQHEPDINISNICAAVVENLKELLKTYLHNDELKKNIILELTEVEKQGKISSIINVFADQQRFINDYNGYYEACKRAKIIEQKIQSINDESAIFNNALLLGQKATVLISYITCFIVTVAVII